jgi:hypothetical protein
LFFRQINADDPMRHVTKPNFPVGACFRFATKIPVTFMTGFYIANVVSRDRFYETPF